MVRTTTFQVFTEIPKLLWLGGHTVLIAHVCYPLTDARSVSPSLFFSFQYVSPFNVCLYRCSSCFQNMYASIDLWLPQVSVEGGVLVLSVDGSFSTNTSILATVQLINVSSFR